MNLTVASIDKVLWKGDATSVTLPTPSGELTILRGHMPLISTLVKGTIRIKAAEKDEKIALASGLLLIEPSGVTILM